MQKGTPSPEVPVQNTSTAPIFIKSGKKHFQVQYHDIIYLEAYGSYTKVHLTGETILASKRISFFENSLPDTFLRIHKSYIVSVSKIKMIAGNQIAMGEKKLPIGNSYKLQVRKKLLD